MNRIQKIKETLRWSIVAAALGIGFWLSSLPKPDALLPQVTQAQASVCYQIAYPLYGGNVAHNRDASCASRFNGTIRRLWTLDLGGVVEMPPTASHSVLYTAQDNGRLSAVSALTGKMLWEVNRHVVMTASPAVWHRGGLLFVTSRSGPGLVAVNIHTGQTVWRTPHFGPGEAAPVLVSTKAGLRVYAVNSEGQMGAWNARTGKRAWIKNIGPVGVRSRFVGGVVVPFADPIVDSPATACPTPPPPPPNHGGGSNYRLKYTGSPAYSNGIFYVVNYGGDVWAITRQGKTVWHQHYPSLGAYANPAYRDGAIYIVSRSGVTARLSARTGQIRWSTNTGYLAYGSPALSNNALYTSSYDGRFWKLDMSTGRVLWSLDTHQNENTSPVVVGGRVFFGIHGVCKSQHGSVVAYRTVGMKQVWHFDDGRYTPVVISGNILVVVGFGHIYGFVRH